MLQPLLLSFLPPILACTSVPIKISYHADDDLVAVVHFMDRADFKHEIDVTLGDIGGDDTNLESPETSSAWAKVSPDMIFTWSQCSECAQDQSFIPTS